MMITGQHKVLMADMTWKAAQDVTVGDLLSVPWLIGAIGADGSTEAPARFPLDQGHLKVSPGGTVVRILQISRTLDKKRGD